MPFGDDRSRWVPWGAGIVHLTESQKKTMGRILLIGVVGIALLLSSTFLSRDGYQTTGRRGGEPARTETGGMPVPDGGFNAVEQGLARELERVLVQVKGAGRVTVSVTLTASSQRVVATNESAKTRESEEQDVGGGRRFVREEDRGVQVAYMRPPGGGGEEPVVTRVLRPEIGGVVVVADGAGRAAVKARLVQAVVTALDVPVHRVTVLERKAGD